MALRLLATTSLSCILTLAGCSDESSERATADCGSLDDKVAKIVELRNKIRDGFASDDVDSAHGPLHAVGDMLEELSQLTTNSDLPSIDKQAIEGHINTLFAAFGEVDKTLHGQEGSTYNEEASTIDEAMENLVRICQSSQ